MWIILALFIFGQSYADTTWREYGATLENTHAQRLRGAMLTAPYVKWSYQTGGRVVSYGAAVADIDKDDTIEVVIGSNDSTIYCLNGVTGAMEWTNAEATGIGNGVCFPAIADVDKDDTVEVVHGSWDSTVYCLNGVTGGMKWSYYAGGRLFRGISVADLDMDDKLEALVPNYDTDSLTCINGEDGGVLWKIELASQVNDLTIADIDLDGCVELIVGTAGENKIWALGDFSGQSDCGSYGVEEKKAESQKLKDEIEFLLITRGIYVFAPNAVEVNIKIYDVCGRLRQVLYKGVLSKGGHTFIPNIKTSGIYFVVLHAHKLRQSLKIIRF